MINRQTGEPIMQTFAILNPSFESLGGGKFFVHKDLQKKQRFHPCRTSCRHCDHRNVDCPSIARRPSRSRSRTADAMYQSPETTWTRCS